MSLRLSVSLSVCLYLRLLPFLSFCLLFDLIIRNVGRRAVVVAGTAYRRRCVCVWGGLEGVAWNDGWEQPGRKGGRRREGTERSLCGVGNERE